MLIGDVMSWDGEDEDKPDPYEVRLFLEELDESGDGALDRQEFQHFVHDGMTMSDADRLDYASTSPMHARFMLFLENMVIAAENDVAK